MRTGRIKFLGVRAGIAQRIPGKFYRRRLHAQTDPQVRNLMLPGVMRRHDLAFDAAVAKAAGNQNSIAVPQDRFRTFLRDGLRFNPANFHLGSVGITAVAQRFGH